ncbi:MAG: hypothetical protein Q27BPR15_05410 [Rhodobacter sp. CACIA14H1]|nr:MAG: hypothetical protein Q27BPR15_05410 [Rhodobacter sp. CACIA14H1]
MTGASKILTVSYGTFSCTLEGFDDPFNTMKAIAEYFRDLAAEDRYFGAEPPTPDAAMLHRIAEREIQRRVEAKIQENGVVLRASEAVPEVAAPAVPQPVAEPVAAAAPAEPVVAAPVVLPSVAAATEPAAESIVEKLSRLRSEVAAQPGTVAPVATVPFVSFAIPDYIEDQEVEDLTLAADPVDLAEAADFLPEDAAPADAAAADLPLPEELPEELPADDAQPEGIAQASEDLSAPVEDELPEALVADTGTVEDEPALVDLLVGAFDSEESVVAETAVDAVTVEEAEPAEEVAQEAELSIAAVLGALADPAAPAATDDTAAYGQDDDAVLLSGAADEPQPDDLDLPETEAVVAGGPADFDDDLAATLEGLIGEEEPATAEAAAAEPPQEQSDDAQDSVEAGLAAAFAEDAPVEYAEGESETGPDDGVAAAAEPAPAPRNEAIAAIFAPDEDEIAGQSSLAPAGVNGIDLRPGAAEKLQRARARVIRIRRSEESAEAAPAAAAPDAEPETAPVEASPAPAAAAMTAADEVRALLSAEDEAELQRELAALRAADEEAEAAAQQEARKALEAASADDAVGRLMQQADTEMEGTETRRRQSAIAHLKAAVAATVAERKVTGDKPAEESTVSRLARYRNDLAMVVKSALPKVSGEKAPAERPAPLVLVSEQRIDRPRGTAAAAPAASPAIAAVPQPAPGGIRPRRVSSAGLAMQASPAEYFDDEDGNEDVANLFGETRGFAEFVERVGATTLEQMLEASAAYLAGVEGREHFSRPQLMWHVSAVVPQGTFQREDGLRSFGSLLREGRIAKVRRGQFALSDESPYLAEAKKIAG